MLVYSMFFFLGFFRMCPCNMLCLIVKYWRCHWVFIPLKVPESAFYRVLSNIALNVIFSLIFCLSVVLNLGSVDQCFNTHMP